MSFSIWSRLVFYKIHMLLLVYLCGFFCLYSFIDYSTRWHDFSKNTSLKLSEILIYYSQVFVKRLDIILPLALMIACLKVLLDMNKKRESIALFTSGLKKTTFLQPLLLSSAFASLTLFLSFQYLTPKSLLKIENFEQKYFNHSLSSLKTSKPHFLRLSNNSLLIYGAKDVSNTRFMDVFYLISSNELWRCASLTFEPSCLGCQAEHFVMDEEGHFFLKEHMDVVNFDPLSIIYDSAIVNPLTIECGSFSFLLTSLKKIQGFDPQLKAKISSQIFYKISVIFLPFLITMVCACFGLVFSRKLPIFMIYAMCIFGMIGYFLIMDAAMIFGDSRVLPSYLALPGPFVLIFLFFLPRFIRCCKN
jgi:lipopolysaccharide export system permease protein